MHMAHQTDEYCPVQHIEQAAEAYLTIARRWARTLVAYVLSLTILQVAQ